MLPGMKRKLKFTIWSEFNRLIEDERLRLTHVEKNRNSTIGTRKKSICSA
jgi:hypothetical protein